MFSRSTGNHAGAKQRSITKKNLSFNFQMVFDCKNSSFLVLMMRCQKQKYFTENCTNIYHLNKAKEKTHTHKKSRTKYSFKKKNGGERSIGAVDIRREI